MKNFSIFDSFLGEVSVFVSDFLRECPLKLNPDDLRVLPIDSTLSLTECVGKLWLASELTAAFFFPSKLNLKFGLLFSPKGLSISTLDKEVVLLSATTRGVTLGG